MLPDAIIYSDGSSGQNRHGGWSCIVATPASGVELWGFEYDTTNNRMEMVAAIKGLKFLGQPYNVKLVSDSAYMLNTIKNKWYQEWIEHNYQRKNMDLWLEMSEILCYHTVTTVKVKGHSGVEHNERVDKLAKEARINQDEGMNILYGELIRYAPGLSD